ncbi:MAG: hypothetical protein K2X03_06860 [Bryobacteraceae bacterium]|nr:hypothetical protein [Bryobacteraceae bacterium]
MILRLFIHGQSSRSQVALENLRAFCRERQATVQIEVVDVQEDAGRAEQDRVIATPTLLRLMPMPTVRILGDLSDPQSLSRLLDGCQARVM